VNDNGTAFGQFGEPLFRRGFGFPGRLRKAVAKANHVDLPAHLLQFSDDAAVVSVSAGRRRKIARHRERDAVHHNGASYDARATCDSEMMMRIAFNSRPGRPSSPARAAFASWS